MRWFLPLSLLCAACSGTDSTPDAGVVDGGVVDCTNDPRVQAYAPGVSVMDASGARKFVLQTAEPSPPARGTNAWTVQVQDGSGAAIPDLPLSVSAFMPDHGHGSSVEPQLSGGSGGTYDVGNLYFFMPGVWRVTLEQVDGGSGTAAQFFFCVEG